MRKSRRASKAKQGTVQSPQVDAITREVTLAKAARLAELGQIIDQELKKIQVSAILHEAFLRAMTCPDSVLPRMAVKV